MKPKLKNELKILSQVCNDSDRLNNMLKRINKRIKNNPNYVNNANKSVIKYTKSQFKFHNSIIEDINCKRVSDSIFETEYVYLDKLNNHLSRHTKITDNLISAIRLIKHDIIKLYITQHSRYTYKLIRKILKSNINSSQIITIIIWLSKTFEPYLINYDNDTIHIIKLKKIYKKFTKLYVDEISIKNNTIITNIVYNDYYNTKKQKLDIWLLKDEQVYYTSVITVFFKLIIENVKIVHETKNNILLLAVFVETLGYLEELCNKLLIINYENVDTLRFEYILACINNTGKMIELFNNYLTICQTKYNVKLKSIIIDRITTVIMLLNITNNRFITTLVNYVMKDIIVAFTHYSDNYHDYFGKIIRDTLEDYADNDIKNHLEQINYFHYVKNLMNIVVSELGKKSHSDKLNDNIEIIKEYFIEAIPEEKEMIDNKFSFNTTTKIS